MTITPKKYARALCELAQQPGTDIGELVGSFIALLGKHHTLNFVPSIIKEIDQFYTANTSLSLTARVEYTNYRNPAKELEEELKRLYPGRTIKVEARKNPALIGGSKMIIEGQLIDATILGQLQRAEKKLSR